MTAHESYVPAESTLRELTVKALLLGVFFGLLFGATTTYLALKVGLTVTASIPIAVLAISLFKRFGNSSILENNIVQTTGSAGESIAAGVAFTVPALLFLPSGEAYFHYTQIATLALCGGMLGVLFMIPLRRSLIVQEHGSLPFPEGTACADVLIAGEKGGSLAHQVFLGIGIASIYKTLMSIFGLWKEIPSYTLGRKTLLPNANLTVEVTPELLGVGYLIGPRIAGVIVAGSLLSSLLLIPLITFFGDALSAVIEPGEAVIASMGPREIWSHYVRYIGAGAVTLGGILTMIKTLPTIASSVTHTLTHLKQKRAGTHKLKRTDLDLPFSLITLGSLGIIVFMALFPKVPVTWFSALLIAIGSFFFVTVAARTVGIVGTSSNPVSGMTIAMLMGSCFLFLLYGMTDVSYQPIILCIGAIVAISASNAGNTAQDLKTGYLVGATPWKQQLAILIGVIASTVATGFTLLLLSETIGIGDRTAEHLHPLPAPQATLIATLIKGMMDQSLPGTLVVLGMVISAVVELCGVSSLAFAVGVYLPLSTTAPIFIGGLIKWIAGLRKKPSEMESEMEPGSLFAAGLIAGGALLGIIVAICIGTSVGTDAGGKELSLIDLFHTGLDTSFGAAGDLIAVAIFLVLCALLLRASYAKAN